MKALTVSQNVVSTICPDIPQPPLVKREAENLRVERGVKMFRRAYSCQVIGSRSMDWILSLSPRDWTAIYVDPDTLQSSLGVAIRKRLKGPLRLRTPLQNEPLDVILVAGSDAEMSQRLRSRDWGNTPRIIIGKDWATIGNLGAGGCTRIAHRAAGGVTDWKGVLATGGWKFQGWLPKVRRDVSHVIKYSEKPTCCDKSPPFPHLASDALLPVYGPWNNVVFHTYATRTNWGHRPLLPYELAGALDLPVWLMEDEALLRDWLPTLANKEPFPLKVLQASIEAFFGATPSTPSPVPETPFPRAAPFSSRTTYQADPVDTRLKGLSQVLPGTWVDAGTVTMAASKADNAEISTRLWDARILLVLPWLTLLSLNALRNILHRVWQRRVTSSFRHYLAEKYGHNWAQLLIAGRRCVARSTNVVEGATHNSGGDIPKSGGFGDKKLKKRSVQTISGQKSAPGKAQMLDRTADLLRDVEVGTEALEQVQASSWWEWTQGSALLFWRWGTLHQRRDAQDGMNIYVKDTMPKNTRPQRRPKPHVLKMVAAKVAKVRKRRYIRRGIVKSLTDYFDVPKGKSDIRMVYNGTTSGLNEALWAPSFYMPTANAAARLMSWYTWCVDLDLGEMFLNFPMDLKVRPFAGVDLTPLASILGVALQVGSTLWERWERLFMGMKSSPYNAVRYFYLAEEFARGNPQDSNNALRYDRVVLNLPGMSEFDPSLPNVMKWNDRVDRIAGDVVTFVDDLRATGFDKENSWQVARQVASRLQHLGIQDAPRKRRPPSRRPGAWAGCVFLIDQDSLRKTVTQDKWDKARRIVMELDELCQDAHNLPELDH